MKEEIGHKISLIYERCEAVVRRRSLPLKYRRELNDPIHQEILAVLSDFAEGDRYSNIDILIGGKRRNDPIAAWYTEVDLPLFEAHVSSKKKRTIRANAEIVGNVMGPVTMVRHLSETGGTITEIEDASYRTGVFEAVGPYRQLYVLQVIRFWVELLSQLHDLARAKGLEIPHFLEIFAIFYNDDLYFKTRRTWDKL